MAAVRSEVCFEDPPGQDGANIKYLPEFQRLRHQVLTRWVTKLIIVCIKVYCVVLSCSPECQTVFHFCMAHSSGTSHYTEVRTDWTLLCAPHLTLQSWHDDLEERLTYWSTKDNYVAKKKISLKFHKVEYTGCLWVRMATATPEVGILNQQFHLSLQHHSSKNSEYYDQFNWVFKIWKLLRVNASDVLSLTW